MHFHDTRLSILFSMGLGALISNNPDQCEHVSCARSHCLCYTCNAMLVAAAADMHTNMQSSNPQSGGQQGCVL